MVNKERRDSVVTETPKDGILISIDISKELNYYADPKYLRFIKFSVTDQKLIQFAWFSKKVRNAPMSRNINEIIN